MWGHNPVAMVFRARTSSYILYGYVKTKLFMLEPTIKFDGRIKNKFSRYYIFSYHAVVWKCYKC